MSPYLIIVGLPLICSIVGAIYIWRTPKYAAKPVPDVSKWREEKPRVDMDAEMEEQAA
jgi:hypothetical protein